MKVLFVCTSGKDRSVVMAQVMSEYHPEWKCRTAGINQYNTLRWGTRFLNESILRWADVVIPAEHIHWKIIRERFPGHANKVGVPFHFMKQKHGDHQAIRAEVVARIKPIEWQIFHVIFTEGGYISPARNQAPDHRIPTRPLSSAPPAPGSPGCPG